MNHGGYLENIYLCIYGALQLNFGESNNSSTHSYNNWWDNSSLTLSCQAKIPWPSSLSSSDVIHIMDGTGTILNKLSLSFLQLEMSSLPGRESRNTRVVSIKAVNYFTQNTVVVVPPKHQRRCPFSAALTGCTPTSYSANAVHLQ